MHHILKFFNTNSTSENWLQAMFRKYDNQISIVQDKLGPQIWCEDIFRWGFSYKGESFGVFTSRYQTNRCWHWSSDSDWSPFHGQGTSHQRVPVPDRLSANRKQFQHPNPERLLCASEVFLKTNQRGLKVVVWSLCGFILTGWILFSAKNTQGGLAYIALGAR